VDTLAIARKKFPGAPASLDALCRRFGVDNSNRELHGALLDSELLAGVYLELSGGRQPGLIFQDDGGEAQAEEATQDGGANSAGPSPRQPQRRRERPLQPRITEDERARHAAFLNDLPHSAIWMKDGDEA